MCMCGECVIEQKRRPVLRLSNQDIVVVDRLMKRTTLTCPNCKLKAKSVPPVSFLPPALLILVGKCPNSYKHIYDVAGSTYGAFGVVLADNGHNVLKMWDKDTDRWMLADDSANMWVTSECPHFVVKQPYVRVVGLRLLDQSPERWLPLVASVCLSNQTSEQVDEMREDLQERERENNKNNQ